MNRGLHNAVVGLALLLVVVFCAFHAATGYSSDDLSASAWGLDDAYINYRYARNLSDGTGLVYNPGEQVEGYSSLLYTLGLAAFLGPSQPLDSAYPVSVALNIVFMTIAFVLFYRLVWIRTPGLSSAASALLFSLCVPLLAWVGSGMETAMVLMLQIGLWSSVELNIRRESLGEMVILGVSTALLCAATADGFILPLVAVVYLLLGGKGRAAAVAGVAGAVSTTSLLGWRLWHFGYPFPNAFYLKLQGSFFDHAGHGLTSLWQVAMDQRLLLFMGLVVAHGVVVWVRAKGQRGSIAARVPFPLVAMGALLLDWLIFGSFGEAASGSLVLLFPLGIFAFIEIARISVRRRTVLAVGATLLAVAQMSVLLTDARFEFTPAEGKYDRWMKLGQFLGKKYKGSTLATEFPGKLAYYSGMYTIDLSGKTDKHLAHLEDSPYSPGCVKLDPDYVMSRKPDVMVASISGGRDMGGGLYRELYERAGYRVRYLTSVAALSRIWIFEIRGLEGESLGRKWLDAYTVAVVERLGLFPWSYLH